MESKMPNIVFGGRLKRTSCPKKNRKDFLKFMLILLPYEFEIEGVLCRSELWRW